MLGLSQWPSKWDLEVALDLSLDSRQVITAKYRSGDIPRLSADLPRSLLAISFVLHFVPSLLFSFVSRDLLISPVPKHGAHPSFCFVCLGWFHTMAFFVGMI